MAEKTFSARVPPSLDGARLDAALRALFSLSDHQIRILKRTKGLTIDGKNAYVSAVVRAGQQVRAVCESPRDQGIAPEPGPLAVLYEDEDLLIANKPAPMATTPTRDLPLGALANRVAAYEGRAPFVFRPVNRLDRGTSGIVVCARSAPAQQRLIEALHTPDFVREYLAVTEGLVEEDEGCVRAPIGKPDGGGPRRCVRPDGRPAATRFLVLSRFLQTRRTLLLLRPETGRTHQIRVHLASIGHPVTGDALYGAPCPDLPGRFALHAWRVSLTQPFTGAHICVRAPLPEAFLALSRPRSKQVH